MEDYSDYKNIELWDDKTWEGKESPIKLLSQWMGAHGTGKSGKVDDSLYAGKGNEACYINKTLSYDVPDVIDYWDSVGIHYECREMGGTRWISMVPVSAYEDKETRIPAILVFHQENYNDKYWAMHTVQQYASLNAAAAKDNMMVLYVTAGSPEMEYNYIGVINEAVDLFPMDPKRIYLDVSPVIRERVSLRAAGLNQNVDTIFYLGSAAVPVIDISDLWQSSGDNWLWMLSNSSADFDRDAMVHSEQGEKIAFAADFQYSYSGPDDAGLKKFFNDRGVDCLCHDYKGHRWASAVPLKWEKSRKLPVMLIFQEVNYASDYFVLTAYSQYYEFIRLAGEGELIALFFARETPDNNDMFRDILDEACGLYPIDRSRVYVTGHSHNGNFAMEFMRRHSDIVAAVAALGDQPGMPSPADCIEPVKVTDDKIELMRTLDIPVANISGMCEMGCMFPVGRYAGNKHPEKFCQLIDDDGRVRSWQRRLYAFNIPQQSAEEIKAAPESDDRVTAKLGIPGGRRSLETIYGTEHYIADYDNADGKWRLRIIAIDNMPHMPVPSMEAAAWDFVKRFAKNTETGETIELS